MLFGSNYNGDTKGFYMKYPPKLNVEITEAQRAGLNRLPYGDRKAVFSALVDMVNDLLDKNPGKEATLIATIAERHLGLRDLLKWQ